MKKTKILFLLFIAIFCVTAVAEETELSWLYRLPVTEKEAAERYLEKCWTSYCYETPKGEIMAFSVSSNNMLCAIGLKSDQILVFNPAGEIQRHCKLQISGSFSLFFADEETLAINDWRNHIIIVVSIYSDKVTLLQYQDNYNEVYHFLRKTDLDGSKINHTWGNFRISNKAEWMNLFSSGFSRLYGYDEGVERILYEEKANISPYIPIIAVLAIGGAAFYCFMRVSRGRRNMSRGRFC